MEGGLSIGLTCPSAVAVLGAITGPIITALPTTSAPNAIVDSALTGEQGLAVARNGGVVSGTNDWLLDGAVVATGMSYTPAIGQIGQVLLFRVTWTETGGSADGSVTRAVSLGPVRSSARINAITGGVGQITIDYDGTLTFSGADEHINLEIA